MTSFRKTLGVLSFLVAATAPLPSFAQDCPNEPEGMESDIALDHRTLVVSLYNRNGSDQPWRSYEVRPDESPRVGFNQNPICFYYGVRSDETTRVGALVVTVVRNYSERDENSEWVYLYRGDGFYDRNGASKTPQEHESLHTLDFYDEFHDVRNPLPDPDFERDFHAYWSDKEDSSTAQPLSKRSAFRYDERGDTALRRTYLLHYSTSRNGSWIPFDVEPYRPQYLDSVEVTVWDFGDTIETSTFNGMVLK